jgi:hypothetical protein
MQLISIIYFLEMEKVCSHIIALLYIVNYWVSMKMTEIPADMSCTEVGQVWHEPHGDKIESDSHMSRLAQTDIYVNENM